MQTACGPASGGPKYSLVIPFFNEARGVRAVLEELQEYVSGNEAAEVWLLDDGSTDGTGAILEDFARDRAGWCAVRQRENQGQAATLLHGMRLATAPVIVTMDGDGQNHPGDIVALLRLLEESGVDMVAGAREIRMDSWLRRRMSRIANGVRQRLLADGVSDTGCALKAFRREVAGAFLPLRTLYSFMPALAVAAGYRVVEFRVRHRPRLADESKYGLGAMLWKPMVDMFGIWWFNRRRVSVPQ